MFELREGDLDSFFAAPFTAYGASSLYVSPMKRDLMRYLDAARNPLFRAGNPRRFFTVHRDGQVLGRIVAHLHGASNRLHGLSRCYFGFFDCADEFLAAETLLRAAEAFAREQDCRELAGNFNLTAMQQIGVLTGGFERSPYTDMMYNPPHVPALLERLGYERFFPVTTFEVDLQACDPAAILGGKGRAAQSNRDFRWVGIDRRHFRARLEEARVVLNDGFAQNPMFVPLTEDEFRFHAGEMLWILDPRISCVVQANGAPAGVVVCIPDVNPFLASCASRVRWDTPLRYLWHRWHRRRAVIIYYSVARNYQGRGLNSAMLYRVVSTLRDAGYERLGVTWISDQNAPSLQQMRKIGAQPYQRLHLFRKQLS